MQYGRLFKTNEPDPSHASADYLSKLTSQITSISTCSQLKHSGLFTVTYMETGKQRNI